MTDKKKEFLRILKFVGFSVSAGVIQILSFTLLYEVCGLIEWASHLISLVLSVVWNFTFNRKFTFQSAANVPIAMIKVACFYLVFTPLSTLGLNYLVSTCGWDGFLTELLMMLANFVLEFLYQRFFVFASSLDTNQKATESEEKAE